MADQAKDQGRPRYLSFWRRLSNREPPALPDQEQAPLRAELLSVEQLGRYAKALAATHHLASERLSDKLIPRLDENERVLLATYELVTRADQRARRIAPAAEWLLDNFYLIEEQIRTARRHLPRSYSQELPRLKSGAAQGFPRVYALAEELIAHVDGRVEADGLSRFIAAYQTSAPLQLGELWAVPIMLRLALIENLRRVAAHVAVGRRDRDLADDWAERMVQAVEHNPTDLVLVLADMARADPPLSGAFVAELTRHLQGQSPHLTFVNSWLEQRLAERGQTAQQLVLSEAQAQAADQVSMGNSITSLRFVSTNDWREFVEEHSVVEQALRKDPAQVYAQMDITTRDRYRHVVEDIARRSPLSEVEVADQAVLLAAPVAQQHPEDRTAHVGYYLYDDGRPALERSAQMRTAPGQVVSRIGRRWPLFFYSLGILTVAAGVMALCLRLLPEPAGWRAHPLAFALCALAVFLCATHLGIATINWLATLLVLPRRLPRLDFSEGIPPEHRTMVVVPTMLGDADGVASLLEGLEVRYLANRDNNLHFALLTDLEDAATEVRPADEALVAAAREGIIQLNRKHGGQRSDIFYLLHRPRRWNPRQGVWMGYERKRGKLAEFNALLRSERPENRARFSAIIGDTSVLPEVRYVITLDTDTQLPHDAAREMVGAMAHTLNRPVFDARRRRVAKGYAILQPRVSVSLASAQRSWFVRLFAGDVGIDPYTRLVSDVYQDLFGEGSFIGKGIYDVDAFERSCAGFPENAILSHDLLESAHARSALLSDVELYEDYPSRFLADIKRRHRWIRGDWQIARWLLPLVPRLDNRQVKNPISVLSWWKIFDNLRRSIMPLAMLGLLLCCWLVPGLREALRPRPWLPTLLVLLVAGAVPLLSLVAGLVRKPRDYSMATHLQVMGVALGRHAAQFLFTLVFLPYDAFTCGDAIVRTLVRMLITRRRMLEWQTASSAERSSPSTLTGFFLTMVVAPLLALATVVLLWREPGGALPSAAPLLILWLLSPGFAWWLSRPTAPVRVRLSDEQRAFLGKLSRRTWRYFEAFVTQEESWLPPDNIQEFPSFMIASRTSPTNIGMALLANLAAYDFGYCSTARTLARTQQTCATLAGMERFRGHFYNWYNTRTRKPLLPLYISTVDSGNLSGLLLVLRNGLLELCDAPLLPPRIAEGLRDTTRILQEVARERKTGAALLRLLDKMTAELARQPDTLAAASAWLAQLVVHAEEIKAAVAQEPPGPELIYWAGALLDACVDHRDDLRHLTPPELSALCTLRQVAALPSGQHARDRITELEQAAAACQELAAADPSFLYSPTRDLFAIGYHVEDRRLDGGFYDLLASEARLASFVAIAEGKVGREHWFALGRLLTSSGGASALLSWSGSMFEYLMPLLVMPTYENTLLDQTYKGVVRRQTAYGRQHDVPWGISESGYNTLDAQGNYQYRAFGIPGLGFKRGLAEDLVIAPYASALALMVAPEEACANLERLNRDGAGGAYGLYEAIDFTTSRVPAGERSAIVRQFMAHHQGMSLLSLAYLLLGRPMQRRFLADPGLRGAALLLQERVPKTFAPIFPHVAETEANRMRTAQEEGTLRVFTDPGRATPDVNLLSNGRYHVMVTSAGGGYSRWRDLQVTRWREDPTRDAWGSFCYLRDVDSGKFWSTAWQPTLSRAERYEAIFTPARAEFRRRDELIDSHMEISVSPEDDIELRRLTLTNWSDTTRTIEVTSYAEVVLCPPGADLSHPAFSNLFVQTELVRDRHAILCTRRPRSPEEHPPWMVHLMTVRGATVGEASFETDRMKFIGRGRTLAAPAALRERGPLSGSAGSVLDPVASLRQVIRLAAGETVSVDMVTGVADTREAVTALMDKYHDRHLADRVFDLAWTHSHILLRQLNATEAEAQLYGRLVGSVLYATAQRRAQASILSRNRRGQSGLWGYGISGDLPIVLVRLHDASGIALVRQLVQAHAYWRMKGIRVDLVLWNEDSSGYLQVFQESIMDLIAASPEAALVDKPGGIFVRRGDQMSEEDRVLLLTVARVVLQDDAGPLAEQIERRDRSRVTVPLLKPPRRRGDTPPVGEVPVRDLAFWNGLGGFSHDGREYITILAPGRTTPAPWVNVIANAQLGTVVSESGSVYSFAENSHEFRLTPWYNDPVSDMNGEALYLRDEESGRFWSPTPLPARGRGSYIARHGFGYSIFEYSEDGIVTELCLFVAPDEPVKIARLRISNRSGRPRRLSVTGYWEWVLGELRDQTLMHVVTNLDPVSGALFARNPYSAEFAGRIAFVDCSEAVRTVTGDRLEFLGRNGSAANPASLHRVRLSGRVGAGLDPCAAMQVQADLADGQDKDVVFVLGAARDEAQARALGARFRGASGAQQALEGVWRYWSRTLGTVYCETPDPAVNFLANGWLVYQVLSSRMWARTGFYQSGGAYGFRDQLQDAMALVHAEPALLRAQLLRAAGRQFPEGDVQHWWHPPGGRGVRTQCSDDYLWLVYATCRYVAATGDTGVLEERTPLLSARPLRADEESNYDLPQVLEETLSLYDHCVRALDHGLRFGAQGLPLMGCGDWNDGMNLVGVGGRGESVWLAFFLYDVLMQFADLGRRRGDAAHADKYTLEAGRLRGHIEDNAWDGEWYRRAYFDDGQPLGAAQNQECRIDSIAQSWSVLSGAGTRERALTGLRSADRLLVREDAHLIELLTPPFDKSPKSPGYIQGYVPGVRENGGQYTHAAVWMVMAFAALGDSKRAWELFALINPLTHASTPEGVATYRVEPYVVAADVYAVAPHTGRGGWTWYTGSAGWMYRLLTESLLGLQLRVDQLHFAPCLPASWPSFKIHYRYRETFYHLTIRREGDGEGTVVQRVMVDGNQDPHQAVPLVDDRRDHHVEVVVGAQK